MNDRLRAKPPKTNTDAWTEGVIVDVEQTDHVTVTVDSVDEKVEVEVTEAIYDLFAGRLEEDVIGATVYYIKKTE